MRFETLAIHAGERPDAMFGAISVPIYQTSTFMFEDVDKTRGYDYSRMANPNMSHARALRCRRCGQEYPLQPLSLCDFCLSPLEVSYDYTAMAGGLSWEKLAGGPLSMWRYRDMLPVEGEVVDIGTGFTPLVKADNLGGELGLDQLYIKNDCLNSTYSFKDRPVSVAATKAQEFGFVYNHLRRCLVSEFEPVILHPCYTNHEKDKGVRVDPVIGDIVEG